SGTKRTAKTRRRSDSRNRGFPGPRQSGVLMRLGGKATMETTILHTFENTKENIKVYVAQVTSGYSVALQDTECGEFIGAVIYPDLAWALVEAKKIMNAAATGKPF